MSLRVVVNHDDAERLILCTYLTFNDVKDVRLVLGGWKVGWRWMIRKDTQQLECL